MSRTMWALAAVVVAAWTSAATADPLGGPAVFTGGGSFARQFGTLPATGSALVGDSFSFGFTFDLGAATAGVAPATYIVPVTGFEAFVGHYDFTPASGNASLRLSQGFAFFGNPFSEASRLYSFSFSGSPRADAPFAPGPGGRENLSITVIYRDDDPTRPLTLADVINPTGPALRSVSYSASAAAPDTRFGSLAGPFGGGFAYAAAPEPAAWALMILGFGATGAALRRRRMAVWAIA